MHKRFAKRGSGFNAHRGRNTHKVQGNYSRFPRQRNNKSQFEWSEEDLVKFVQYTKKAVDYTPAVEMYENTLTFDSLPINTQLKNNIAAKGYLTPTPVQDKAIPLILSGSDLIGVANTGTGKTAAFLIPLIDKVYKDKAQKVLIIAPTRELAQQIATNFRELANNTGIYCSLLIGGSNMQRQIDQLKKMPHFVIGTPGRIRDLLHRKYLNLSTFNNVVLDETDRMVDIGFVREIELFISLLPKNRQSLFFSATVSGKVQEILAKFVQNPVTINVKKQETGTNIRQEVLRISPHEKKVDTLHTLLQKEEYNKVIVFGNTKWSIQKLSDELVNRGIKAGAIHGNKKQNQRKSILEKFKRNEITVLLATDVASRGLDINNVSHVINYDMPKSHDDYVHRIGRTGRADKLGVALTFINS